MKILRRKFILTVRFNRPPPPTCKRGPHTPSPVQFKSPLLYWLEVVRPGGFELPTFWFVANGVKMLNALFGVAYELERHSSLN